MKIAMDSSVLDIYERMLDHNDRRLNKLPQNFRYSANDERAFDMIDALDKINKTLVSFCRLPSNEDALKRNPKANKHLFECCIEGYDIQSINKRINELHGFYDNLENCCKLLSEAEECGVNIILTTNGLFKNNLQSKAKNNIKILHPLHDLDEILK